MFRAALRLATPAAFAITAIVAAACVAPAGAANPSASPSAVDRPRHRGHPRRLGGRVRPARRQPVTPAGRARHGGRPGHHPGPAGRDVPRAVAAQPPGPDADARGARRPVGACRGRRAPRRRRVRRWPDRGRRDDGPADHRRRRHVHPVRLRAVRVARRERRRAADRRARTRPVARRCARSSTPSSGLPDDAYTGASAPYVADGMRVYSSEYVPDPAADWHAGRVAARGPRHGRRERRRRPRHPLPGGLGRGPRDGAAAAREREQRDAVPLRAASDYTLIVRPLLPGESGC